MPPTPSAEHLDGVPVGRVATVLSVACERPTARRLMELGLLPGTKVNVDRAMFDTIIRNLLSNAIKFTPRGGFVRVSSEKKEDNLIICVEDNGIGISKKLADKLFRIDVSAKRPGTHDEKGTGLGLILCKEFVGYHKGNIWVQSKTGCGSKFFVSIPQTKCKVEEMFIN